jgi:hypothetical protein
MLCLVAPASKPGQLVMNPKPDSRNHDFPSGKPHGPLGPLCPPWSRKKKHIKRHYSNISWNILKPIVFTTRNHLPSSQAPGPISTTRASLRCFLVSQVIAVVGITWVSKSLVAAKSGTRFFDKFFLGDISNHFFCGWNCRVTISPYFLGGDPNIPIYGGSIPELQIYAQRLGFA